MSDKRRPIVRPGFVLALLCVILAPLLLDIVAIVSTCWILATGWITELGRLAKAFHPSWPSLAWFAGGLAGLILGAHLFVRSLRRSGSGWRLRATSASVGLGLFTILAGMALGGTVHQLGWLFGSGQTVLESSWRRSGIFVYRAVRPWVQRTISPESTLETWRTSLSNAADQELLERFVMLVFPNQQGTVEKIAVRVRDGKQFKTIGGLLLERRVTNDGFHEEYLTATEFNAWIASQHK